MKLKSLEDLLHHELRDLYSAETQLLKALPHMARAATHDSLRNEFEQHHSQTEDHIERLQQIAAILHLKLTGLKCKAMSGLIEEGSDLIHEDAAPFVRDAALISSAQRIEHYEIAGYGTARALADLLGHDDVARLLEDTLEEEKETDAMLTDMAESGINVEAAAAED
jgi:ferritin-like metal-binding protein YciE